MNLNLNLILLFCVLEIQCLSTPSLPANGNITCTNSTNLGSQCNYSCFEGYRLITGETAIRTCILSGEYAYWSGTHAECARKSAIFYFCQYFVSTTGLVLCQINTTSKVSSPLKNPIKSASVTNYSS